MLCGVVCVCRAFHKKCQICAPRRGCKLCVLLCLFQDPEVHLKHLKPSPVASPIVDRCIECGFCESNCPSRDITLTPRQRITTFREISRLRSMPQPTPQQKERCVMLPKNPHLLFLTLP